MRPKGDNDPPKKPLSSYNIYFLLERDRIVNGDKEEAAQRVYTSEDVQNIVEQQKWNHTYRKRQHRKTHRKVSFHDLSRVVASSWRQLSDEQKAIFNQQASIEKKIYKQALDAWVMKQMKQGQNHHTIPSPTTSSISHTEKRAPMSTKSYENKHFKDEIMPSTINVNGNECNDMELLSSEEMKYMLGCFNLLPPSTQSTTNSTPEVTGSTNHGYHHHPESDHDPNDWIRLDGSDPLWYDEHQLKGCSEEFALQMIHNNDHTNGNSNTTMYHHATTLDRAITL